MEVSKKRYRIVVEGTNKEDVLKNLIEAEHIIRENTDTSSYTCSRHNESYDPYLYVGVTDLSLQKFVEKELTSSDRKIAYKSIVQNEKKSNS
jgi:hypothetical protein